MDNQKLEINVMLMVQKPSHDVFEAIIDPDHMTRYFIEKSTGRIEEGKTVTWKFAEYDMEFLLQVGKVEEDKYISFKRSDPDGNETLVEITLDHMKDSTLVFITEGSREIDEAGIRWLRINTEGWANFLACLKAYLEYGINLRKGAFDIV